MAEYGKIYDELLKWTKKMMDETGGSKAVIGISGGKDSSVIAALMTKVLGKENVFGVLMPDGVQGDKNYALEICELLGINHYEINIKRLTDTFRDLMDDHVVLSETTLLNLSPRIRMTLLYGISQSIIGSRVINTSNMSEDWVGYATIYGDTAGAFSPLGMLTTEEVIELGRLMEIPEKFLIKPPADGLTGKTDEDVLGLTYAEVNDFIRKGEADKAVKEKIERKYRESRFKFKTIPMFNPGLPIVPEDTAGIYKK